MRYSKDHKELVRRRILRAAASGLRRRGLSAPSVPDVMREAGLTHGGFYGHFSGREQMVAEAVRAAGDETAEKVFRAAPTIEALMDAYLSSTHLQHADSGCVIAALGSDGWRGGRRVRAAFSEVAAGLVALVEQKLDASQDGEADRDKALAITALMVGGVVLGRLLSDPALKSRLLAASKQAALSL